MSQLRLGTFNCENLFARFKFNKNVDPNKASKEGFIVNQVHFDFLKGAEKKLTADVIKKVDADVLALQEVENLDVLKRFRAKELKNKRYKYAILVDGNDPRKIDVAVLSRYPIVAVRSYQELRSAKGPIFSRDCLMVDIQVDSKTLVLFVNHLKSMLDKKDPKNGRKNTRARRLEQSRAVKKIVQSRFKGSSGKKAWAVLGDFNDYSEAGQGTTSGILNLVKWNQVENVVNRLPVNERWTHFYDGATGGETPYRQLDYILLSKSLADGTSAKPVIERAGLSLKAKDVTVKRLKGVTKTMEASDHCPLAIDIKL